MSDVDLYADENEPKVSVLGTMYVVAIGPHRVCRVHLLVDGAGYCELWDYYWFGKMKSKPPFSTEDHATQAEVWEWLREWELVQLRPIGPEDSEYFATAKLTGKGLDPRSDL